MHIEKSSRRKRFILVGAVILIFTVAFLWTRRMSFLEVWDEDITELRLEWYDHMGIKHIQSTTDAEQIDHLRQSFRSIPAPEKKRSYDVEGRMGAITYTLNLQTTHETWIYTFNELIVLTKGSGFPGRHSFWSAKPEDCEALIEACIIYTTEDAG